MNIKNQDTFEILQERSCADSQGRVVGARDRVRGILESGMQGCGIHSVSVRPLSSYLASQYLGQNTLFVVAVTTL